MKNLIVAIVAVTFLAGCACTKNTQQVTPGMSKRQVQLVWGTPRKVETANHSCCLKGEEEEWYYFRTSMQPSAPSKYVKFENGMVKDVHVWKHL